MTLKEFEESVLRTASPVNRDLVQCVLGMMDELGELSSPVKKNRAQGHELDLENIREELGDIHFYWTLACSLMGFDQEEILEENKIKLLKRYPEKFSAERSINRTI
jgi:NTP pyrophosphatase (non-canonical NTP hydrolase)